MSTPHTRRALLRGVLAVTGVAVTAGLAGCDLLADNPAPTTPDHGLDGFLVETVGLAERYEKAIAAVPELGTTLTPVLEAHRAHTDALAAALGATAPAAAGDAPTPTGKADALSSLSDAERKARESAVTACLAASTRLAPLLGSIAAARSSHLEVLV